MILLETAIVAAAIFVLRAVSKRQWMLLSRYFKLCMLLGIAFMPLYYFTQF
jgi:hypothetical protein